jgi:hypothetical protein
MLNISSKSEEAQRMSERGQNVRDIASIVGAFLGVGFTLALIIPHVPKPVGIGFRIVGVFALVRFVRSVAK